MTGSLLLGLHHEPDAGMLGCRPHPLRFMPNDGVYVVGGHDLGSGCDHVGQQGLSPDLM